MADNDRVITDIQLCVSDIPGVCSFCSKHETEATSCREELLKESLELLKEKQPRTYELSELQPFENKASIVWIEAKGSEEILPALIMTIREPYFARFLIVKNGNEETFSWTTDHYGKKWRCWTAAPTAAQIKAERWEDGENQDGQA